MGVLYELLHKLATAAQAKDCAATEHSWRTSEIDGVVVVFCRKCGSGQ